MSMLTSSDRKDFRRQVLFSLAGIGIGLAVAGIIALLINNVLEPKLQVESQDLVEFSGDTFSIWYHVDSPYMDSRYELAAQLEDCLELIPEGCHLVLVSSGKPDARLRTTKALRQRATETSFQLPSAWEGAGQGELVARTARQLGVNLAAGAAEALAEAGPLRLRGE